jgi:hypothetical protein
MDRIAAASSRSNVALFFGALATIAAAAIGAVLAIIFAATVVVIGAMASLLIGLTGFALRARRTARTSADPGLIEARHMGGHSWVAYGWDRRNP